MEVLFWISVGGVLYPYLGYPILLAALNALRARRDSPNGEVWPLPSVSVIVPVHNEEAAIERKVQNTASLRYPEDRLQVVFVSDGSTDQTVPRLRAAAAPAMTVIELPARRGKAAALNAGLQAAKHDILVFTDAAIDLDPDSLRNIVRQFRDPQIGCISGEDRIAGAGGEAWYGRYELFLRRRESGLDSIVGASGSFYAQRRSLCAPFVEGMAPDFLSVLRTVEQGFRAVSEPTATGTMASVKETKREFDRKVRTLIRGMTTLFAHAHLMNPLRFGLFSFELVSHKVMRWLVPFFLVGGLLSSLALLDSPVYLAAFAVQAALYCTACAALAQWGGIHRTFVGKAALYFATVNAAALVAWVRYTRGVRQELWDPSRR